jgi:tetratricopeptide (TPR) repeat protein
MRMRMPSPRELLDQALRENDGEGLARVAEAARAAGDSHTLGLCLAEQALYELTMGRGEAALALAHQAARTLRAAGDQAALGRALLAAAQAQDALAGDGDRAAADLREALALLEATAQPADAAQCLELLARWEPAAARAHLERALASYEASPSRFGAPRVLRKLATLALAAGDAAGARAHLADALRRLGAIRASRQARADEALTLELVGDAHLLAGDEAAARAAWHDALGRLERLGHGHARRLREKLAP